MEHLSKAIHEAPRGSKPGLSNWTYEHLKALLSNDSKRKLQCLIDFADLILNDDNIPFSCKELLRTGILFGTKKKKGGTRPIGLLDIIRRWLTRAIGIPYKKRWAEHLGPTQFAVGTKAGIDKIVHSSIALYKEQIFLNIVLGKLMV